MISEVRRVTPADWPLWRELRLRSLEESPEAFRSTYAEEAERPDTWWEQRVSDMVEDPLRNSLVAERESAGVAILACRIDADSLVMTADAMWVAPEARGYGIANDMLETAMAWGRESGARSAELWVNQGNTATRALYRRAGFRPTTEVQPVRPGASHIILKMSRAL